MSLSATGQRHSSLVTVVVTRRRCHGILLYRQTYPKAHAHDRLVGYMYYNYCMGARLCYPCSDRRSFVSSGARATRIIYAEIDAITVHVYMSVTGVMRYYRGRGNTRDTYLINIRKHIYNVKKRPRTRVKYNAYIISLSHNTTIYIVLYAHGTHSSPVRRRQSVFERSKLGGGGGDDGTAKTNRLVN